MGLAKDMTTTIGARKSEFDASYSSEAILDLIVRASTQRDPAAKTCLARKVDIFPFGAQAAGCSRRRGGHRAADQART